VMAWLAIDLFAVADANEVDDTAIGV